MRFLLASRSIPSEMSVRVTERWPGSLSSLVVQKEPSPQPISKILISFLKGHCSKIQGNQPFLFVLYNSCRWILALILEASRYWFFKLFSMEVIWIKSIICFQSTSFFWRMVSAVVWMVCSINCNCSLRSFTSLSWISRESKRTCRSGWFNVMSRISDRENPRNLNRRICCSFTKSESV